MQRDGAGLRITNGYEYDECVAGMGNWRIGDCFPSSGSGWAATRNDGSELKPEPCHGKYPLLIAAELGAGLRVEPALELVAPVGGVLNVQ